MSSCTSISYSRFPVSTIYSCDTLFYRLQILSMPDPVDDEMWMLLFTYASKHFTDVENVIRLFDQRRQAWGAQHGSAEHSQQTKGTYGIGNAYLLLIGALGRSKRFGLMTKTFHDMLRHGVLPTEVTFVVIMNAFVNSGPYECH